MDEMIKETKEKKPLLKRWWVWVLAIFFGLAAIGSILPVPVETEAEKAAAKLKKDEADRKEAEFRLNGFHCLSRLDGSSLKLIATFKQNLRNPDSFEHIQTRITERDEKGEHVATMKYRAENGFGGMTIGYIKGRIKSDDCSLLSIEEVK
jgi:hypothetical protein